MTDDELRDTFGDELTEALQSRSRFPAPTDIPIAAVNAPSRPRRRRRLFAAALATAIVAGGVAVVALRNPGTTSTGVASSPSTTSPTTLPRALDPSATGVADWTWVSTDQGWALVRSRCGTTVCVSLRSTINGGRTWSSVPTPRLLDTDAQYDVATTCSTHLCASGVRFANSRIGWLFGPAFLQTTDGGRTWTRAAGLDVTDVEASDGVAIRLTTTDPDTCAAGCTYRVEREHLAAPGWRRVTTPVVGGSPSLLILGSDAYLLSVPSPTSGRPVLRRSTDGGNTWTAITDPCAATDQFPAADSAALDGVFVVLCSTPSASRSPSVRISTDGGKTFGARHMVPFDAAGVVRAGSAQTLAAGYSTPSASAVLISRDGGVTWRATLQPRGDDHGPLTLGWENATTARASFDAGTIWTTRDAGSAWTQNPVAP